MNFKRKKIIIPVKNPKIVAEYEIKQARNKKNYFSNS